MIEHDLAITGAEVITGVPAAPPLKNAIVRIDQGKIISIDSQGADQQAYTAKQVLDLTGHLVVPGFINVHTHTILTMVRGVAEDMGFAPAYTPGVPHGHEVSIDEAVALARLGALEAMLFGSTLINDSYVHAEHTLPAMAELGIRVQTCGRIHDVDFSKVHLGEWVHDPAIGEATLAAAVDLLESAEQRSNRRIGVQITPHAPDTCSKSLLRQVSDYTNTRGLTCGTHLSQSEAENRRVQERDGCTPTELLEETGLLNERLLAAHCMYVTEGDIQRAGKACINLAHIPKGNATGGRIAPTRALANAGVNLTLATDNMHADMIEVMRWALCMGRIQEGRIDAQWQPEDMLAMATINGATALGHQHTLGSLEPGKQADLVSIDMSRAHLTPRLDSLGNLVHTGHGRDVSLVMVGGQVVVRDGQAVGVDQDQILQEAQAASEALWARAAANV